MNKSLSGMFDQRLASQGNHLQRLRQLKAMRSKESFY